MARKSPNRYIRREIGGWQVRFHRGTESRYFLSKWFADLKHGGQDVSLAKARAWRDKMEPLVAASAPKPGIHLLHRRIETPKKNNTSNQTGVSLQKRDDKPYAWCAQWREGVTTRKRKTKAFTISRFGYEVARQKAAEHRLRMEAEHYTGVLRPTKGRR